MQLRKRRCRAAKLWPFLFLDAVKNMEKDRKLKDFHFSNVCEKGESPCMF